MGNRPKAYYKAVSDRGREYSLSLQPLDVQRIAALGRWYCLTTEHVARMEVGPDTWNPAWTGRSDTSGTDAFTSKVAAVGQRFAKLTRIIKAGPHAGPLVESQIVDGRRAGWFATPYGATAADLPWPGKSSVNPQFGAHAWMAADVGLQVEALGYRVLSERELSIGVDQHGNGFTTGIESSIESHTGATVTKKPDVAVISRDERTFLAIEVEKWKSRPMAAYTEKLRAYDGNPAVGRVWYLCGSESVANRVRQAAEKVFGDRSFPLRIRVCPPLGTWSGISGLEHDQAWLADLKEFA